MVTNYLIINKFNMARYLHLFNDLAQLDEVYPDGQDYNEPWVSLTESRPAIVADGKTYKYDGSVIVFYEYAE